MDSCARDTTPASTPTDLHPSPFRTFSRADWAALRNHHPVTLTETDIAGLRSLNDHLDLHEVEEIYAPLARLLSLYVGAAQKLFRARQHFLGTEDAKVPYLIGIAGSVAVGKSTTARVVQALLARRPHAPTVQLVTTDGFLQPNAVLLEKGLMERKGFPESYDRAALLRFLHGIKAGLGQVAAPVYSHIVYDIVPGERIVIDRPDVLIVEGLNLLQSTSPPPEGRAIPFVSDFLDFAIYVDADEALLREWYIERFLTLRDTTFRDPRSHFHRYAALSEPAAVETATSIWTRINLVNLRENILPTRQRADLILRKGASHRVEQVALRRI